MARLTDYFGKPTAGVIPYAVVGIVTDNVDPDKLARIQVKFPTLHEEPLSYWIRQISPNAGAAGGVGRGLYALPEIDDEVLVIFLNGNVDNGVILGQFWNGVDKPVEEAEKGSNQPDPWAGTKSTATYTAGSTNLKKNDRRLWRSRSGSLFIFDDTSGKESVQIYDKSLKMMLAFDTKTETIIMANGGKDIHIRTKENLYLEAGKDIIWYAGQNITGESKMETSHKAGTDYKMEAKANLSGKATANVSFEATAGYSAKGLTAALEGSTTTDVKGAMTTLKGSAMTTVQGGMVKIN
jgi:uncharacterized protein involved in type VI secretion and phage assembly